MSTLDLDDREAVTQQIVAALKVTIRTHGHIGPSGISSAAKRVYGQLKGMANDKAKGGAQ